MKIILVLFAFKKKKKYNHFVILVDVLRRLARWKIHLEEIECLCGNPSFTQRQTLLLGLQGQVVQGLQAKSYFFMQTYTHKHIGMWSSYMTWKLHC